MSRHVDSEVELSMILEECHDMLPEALPSWDSKALDWLQRQNEAFERSVSRGRHPWHDVFRVLQAPSEKGFADSGAWVTQGDF